MKTQGKISIIGKIIDEPIDKVVAKFKKAQEYLTEKGWQVINPIEGITNMKISDEAAMKALADEMKTCTAVYMLDCTTECEDAQAMLDHAISENYDIYYENLENIEANGTADSIQG